MHNKVCVPYVVILCLHYALTGRHRADSNIQRVFSHSNLTGKRIICGQNGHYSYFHRLNNGEDRKVCNEVVTHRTSCSLLVLGYVTPQHANIQYYGTCYIFSYTESMEFWQ